MSNLIQKILFLFLFVSIGLNLDAQIYDPNAGYPPIRRDKKDFYGLLRESIANQTGERQPVLKLLPVFTDRRRYITRGRTGMNVNEAYNSPVLKGLFEYDPLDSTSLAIQIDAQLLIDALEPYLTGGGGSDKNCVVAFDTMTIAGKLQEFTFNDCFINDIQVSRDTARIQCLSCN